MGYSIIITAAGKGLRMGTSIPKQFLLINKRPILFYTIEKFYAFDPEIEIVLILPKSQIQFWKELIKAHDFRIDHKIVLGGDTRFRSIKNGLSEVSNSVVGVHDGVRPLVSLEVIRDTFNQAKETGTSIPVNTIN